VIKMNLEETDTLPETVRGEGGFGSTGKWVQS
jgi:dUTP pyrophosphatase